MEITFSIWLASTTRWAHLTKTISMPAVPRVGEFVKFRNAAQGDYFAWKVTQVTYRETGAIEVWTELLDNVDGRGYSFEEEAELDAWMQSYLDEGWTCPRGVGPNRSTARRGTQPRATSWEPLTDSLGHFTENFMAERDQDGQPERAPTD